MKHATSNALDELEPILAEVRLIDSLKEKSRGVFYRGGRAFLHFHEDPKGLFADVLVPGLDRFSVNTSEECQAFLEVVIRHAASLPLRPVRTA